MDLDELEVYTEAMQMGEAVWGIVTRWDGFARGTVGRQRVRSSDSVSANLSEGFGRFFYKENRQFGYYARGCLYETRTWLRKALTRQLVSKEEHTLLRAQLERITRRLNAYIRAIGPPSRAVKEDTPDRNEPLPLPMTSDR
jgi:four helix bundle protein